MNMDCPSVEATYALKPAIIQDCNRHKGYVERSDCMANTHSISRCTCKWWESCFTSLTFQFWTTSFFSPLVNPNYPTGISELPWSKT